MQALFAKLLTKVYLTPTILSLNLQLAAPIQFIPGQFLTFLFTIDGQDHYRPYSLADLDDTRTKLELTLKLFSGGIASKYWQNMLPGMSITCFGPHGDFLLQPSHAQRLILVATGTGIVPFHAMRQQLLTQLQQRDCLHVSLIHGVKRAAELIYRDAFDTSITTTCTAAQLKQHPRFFYRVALSEEAEHIRVQQQFKQLSPVTAQDEIYLCGNSHMIHEMLQLLRDTQAKVFLEKFY